MRPQPARNGTVMGFLTAVQAAARLRPAAARRTCKPHDQQARSIHCSVPQTSKSAQMDESAIAALRSETPGCTCANPRIHLNNAGAAFSPQSVVDSVSMHLALEQEIGGYEAAAEAAPAVQRAYESIAGLINSSPAEISCSENATRAWTLAFCSIAVARAHKGSLVLAATTEYGSNQLTILQTAKRYGATVEFLPMDEYGCVDVLALAKRLDELPAEDVVCLSLTWIGTNGGLVQPAAAIGAVCARAGIPYIVDACQAVGQIVVDVAEIQCDALAATGRKFLRGPRGIGFLYIRADGHLAAVEPALLDIRSAALTNLGDSYVVPEGRVRWECWERPVALWIGLGVAAAYASRVGMSRIEKRVRKLAEYLRDELNAVKGVDVLDRGQPGTRCGIVSFRVRGLSADEVKSAMAKAGVNVSVSSAGSTIQDMTQRGLPEVVRASVHYYNTDDEVLNKFVFLLRRESEKVVIRKVVNQSEVNQD